NEGKDSAWLFQPELVVEDADGKPIFCRRLEGLHEASSDPAAWAERRTMQMLYRHCVEFAVGHGVAVHAETAPEEKDRAVRISTCVVPRYEVPQQTPPSARDIP